VTVVVTRYFIISMIIILIYPDVNRNYMNGRRDVYWDNLNDSMTSIGLIHDVGMTAE